MNKIPIALIYSRIVFGLVIITLSLVQWNYFRQIIIGLIIAGLLSDIFDGIIARHLKISTEKLRRLDSSVDMFFWLSVVTATFLMCREFFVNNQIKIIILIGLEAACYTVSYIKFKKEVATHALSAKLWALTLFASLIQIIVTCNSIVLFNICFYVGVIGRLEVIGMLLVIRHWTNDIPTLYHAFKIRKGKPIRRLKLFNG